MARGYRPPREQPAATVPVDFNHPLAVGLHLALNFADPTHVVNHAHPWESPIPVQGTGRVWRPAAEGIGGLSGLGFLYAPYHVSANPVAGTGEMSLALVGVPYSGSGARNPEIRPSGDTNKNLTYAPATGYANYQSDGGASVLEPASTRNGGIKAWISTHTTSSQTVYSPEGNHATAARTLSSTIANTLVACSGEPVLLAAFLWDRVLSLDEIYGFLHHPFAIYQQPQRLFWGYHQYHDYRANSIAETHWLAQFAATSRAKRQVYATFNAASKGYHRNLIGVYFVGHHKGVRHQYGVYAAGQSGRTNRYGDFGGQSKGQSATGYYKWLGRYTSLAHRRMLCHASSKGQRYQFVTCHVVAKGRTHWRLEFQAASKGVRNKFFWRGKFTGKKNHLGGFVKTSKGAGRRPQAGIEGYLLHCGVDGSPDFTADPWEFFTSLPHTTAPLSAGHTYHFVLRYRNRYGLVSENIDEWTVTPAANAIPSPPVAVSATAASGGTIEIGALYDWAADDAADIGGDHWLVYVRTDGSNPNPATDTPVSLTLQRTAPLSRLLRLAGPYAEGTTVKVLVRVRRSGTGAGDSINTDIHTATATLLGPPPPNTSLLLEPGIGQSA